MRWKLIVLVLLAGALAPDLCVQFAGATVRAALQVLNGMLGHAGGTGHG